MLATLLLVCATMSPVNSEKAGTYFYDEKGKGHAIGVHTERCMTLAIKCSKEFRTSDIDLAECFAKQPWPHR